MQTKASSSAWLRPRPLRGLAGPHGGAQRPTACHANGPRERTPGDPKIARGAVPRPYLPRPALSEARAIVETLPAAPGAPVPYVPFAARCPELARTETRSVTVLPEAHDLDLPPGTYSFLELFCDERSCDCRRVFLLVEASFRPGPEAVIAWGWEPREYYERWSHESDPFAIDQLKGPALNLMATKLGVGPFGGRDLSCGRAC